jgi:D-sedoheptulose 7-phosphate isomerase
MSIENRDLTSSFEDYFERVNLLIKSIQKSDLLNVLDEIKKVKSSGGKIMVIGNGGSAALASHFAADLGSGSILRGLDYPIISLVDNVPVITAAANDYGYENIFARQLINIAKSGDLLMIISSSGNSKNLIEASKVAREIGMKIIGIVGFDGGEIGRISDFKIHVQSKVGEYGQVEDLHSIILHSVALNLRAGS